LEARRAFLRFALKEATVPFLKIAAGETSFSILITGMNLNTLMAEGTADVN